MGDEQHRHVPLGLDPLDEREDLRLGGDVEVPSSGSSATSRAGSSASAIAIITRWRCPPERRKG